MTAISEQSLEKIAMANSRKRRQSGFTLIELMIVVLVLGILAGIAYASYDNAVTTSRRSAGAACLLESSQFMERYYTTNLTYADVGGVALVLPASACRTETAADYTIALAARTATSYSLTATPLGRQLAKDTKCGTLGLTQAGTRSETGSATVAECW